MLAPVKQDTSKGPEDLRSWSLLVHEQVAEFEEVV
jgi:hypothetical protein